MLRPFSRNRRERRLSEPVVEAFVSLRFGSALHKCQELSM